MSEEKEGIKEERGRKRERETDMKKEKKEKGSTSSAVTLDLLCEKR